MALRTGDSCANCYYWRVSPASAGQYAGTFTCRKKAPDRTGGGGAPFPSEPVAGDFWCGEGVDATTGVSFSFGAVGIPSGPAGANGINAPQWTFGTADPDNANGNNGDFYIKFAGMLVDSFWFKSGGVWAILLNRFPP